jgi:phage/plasmid primase-like uncharacterized protein
VWICPDPHTTATLNQKALYLVSTFSHRNDNINDYSVRSDELTALRLRLLSNGYFPVPLTSPDSGGRSPGKRPALPDYINVCRNATEETIRKWETEHPEWTNTGILCGGIDGIDVDVPDEVLADKIEAAALSILGPTPLRRTGQAPKFQFIYRISAPSKKIQTPKLFLNKTQMQVEALGDGQQFAAFGIHPVTKKTFIWDGDGGQTPLDIPASDLPVITEDQIRQFITRAESILRKAGAKTERELKEHQTKQETRRSGKSKGDDLTDLKSRLNQNIARLAQEIVNRKQHSKNRDEVRYGSKGGLCIKLTGSEAGCWTDFESGKGGDVLDLIKHFKMLSFKDALAWAKEWLGDETPDAPPEPELDLDSASFKTDVRKRFSKNSNEDEADEENSKTNDLDEDDAKDAARKQKIEDILEFSRPAEGTPVQKYLRSRGITASPLPECIRCRPYLPNLDRPGSSGAMVAVAVSGKGEMLATHQTYLTEDGQKAPVDVVKRINGTEKWSHKSAVKFPARDTGGGSSIIVLAEGVETALSVWQVTGLETWAVLSKSNFKNAPVPKNAEVIIARDNDESDSDEAEKQIHTAAIELLERCKMVSIASPPDGQDFNDVLQGPGGEEAIREAIRSAIPKCALKSVLASSIKQRAVDWLWENRFALGKIGLIGGMPDRCKGQITCNMIAKVTTGGEWPCNEGKAKEGSVLYFTAEDDIADTVIPRLKAAGADLDRVHIIQMMETDNNGERMFSLVTDLPSLRQKLNITKDVKMVVIDPIASYLGVGKVNSSSASDVRGILAPLKELAEEMRVSVIGIMHFNKKTDVNEAMLRIADSLAYVAAARHCYVVVDHKDTGQRLFVKAKNNIAPDKAALSYEVEVVKTGFDEELDKDIYAPRVVWGDEHVEVTANEAMQAESGTGSAPGATAKATQFLLEMLKNGPVLQTEIEEAAEEQNISMPTLRRVKKDLNIKSTREPKTHPPKWMWQMPDTENEKPEPDLRTGVRAQMEEIKKKKSNALDEVLH